MTQCACRFDGPLSSDEHRRFHRDWEQNRPRPAAVSDDAQVLSLMVKLDEVIARLIECERRLDITPMKPTPGAQAILARAAQERRT